MIATQDDYRSDLSTEILEKAKSVQVVDQQGNTHTFGELTTGRRVCIIFIRHFWCINCRTYVEHIGQSIPPQNLPEGTTIIVIGCGASAPIPAYVEASRSPYPVYGNPDLELYKLFGWKSNLAMRGKDEPQREYMSGVEGLGGILRGVGSALRRVQHLSSVGPKDQNGGEMILEKDGTCSLLHRMENTADHMEIRELAERIGATYTPMPQRRKSSVATNSSKGGCDGDGQSCEARS